jgi:hypothetical protein
VRLIGQDDHLPSGGPFAMPPIMTLPGIDPRLSNALVLIGLVALMLAPVLISELLYSALN